MTDGRRSLDVRTRIVHATSLVKSGHYEYDEYTACGINTSAGRNALDFFPAPPQAEVTCLPCIAEAP